MKVLLVYIGNLVPFLDKHTFECCAKVLHGPPEFPACRKCSAVKH